jgi:hypothetical protein
MSLVADIAPLKEIQKFVWSQGDYERVACEAALPLHSSCRIESEYLLVIGRKR